MGTLVSPGLKKITPWSVRGGLSVRYGHSWGVSSGPWIFGGVEPEQEARPNKFKNGDEFQGRFDVCNVVVSSQVQIQPLSPILFNPEVWGAF